jgi:hypothetical protein
MGVPSQLMGGASARRHQADGWFERPEAGECFRPPATKYPPHGCDLDIADEHERVADPELWQEECSKWRRSVRKRLQRIDGRRICTSSASRRFSSMDNDYRPRRGEPPVQTNRSTEEGRGCSPSKPAFTTAPGQRLKSSQRANRVRSPNGRTKGCDAATFSLGPGAANL